MLLLRASSTAVSTPLSDVTSGCHGITSHLIPPSVVLEIRASLSCSNVMSKGIVLCTNNACILT